MICRCTETWREISCEINPEQINKRRGENLRSLKVFTSKRHHGSTDSQKL